MLRARLLGLLMSLVWSVVIFGLTYLITQRLRDSVIIGLVVFSHWVLDFIVHNPDLPFAFTSSHRLGLSMWGSGPGLVISGILEVILLGTGLWTVLVLRRGKVRLRTDRA